MKHTRTQDIRYQNTNRLCAGESEPPRRRFARGGLSVEAYCRRPGFSPSLLGFPLGASLLTAGEKPHQPQYRFTEIPVPGPSFAVGINDHGLVIGILR